MPVVVGAVAIWNPWHLVYLDASFLAPYLGVAFLAGVAVLWHFHARGPLLRFAGFLGLSLCVPAGLGVVAAWSFFTEPVVRERFVNPDNDVEAELTSPYNVWGVWLRADRGLLSREHRVASIGTGDSAPPGVEARFVDADEFVVTADGEEVYWVRFDPGDLHVEEERCRARRPPTGTRSGRPGCV